MKSQETKGNFPLLESGLWPQICFLRWANHLACASASQTVKRDYNCFSLRCFTIHIWKALGVINIQACDVWHAKIPCCLITGALWMFFDIKTAAGSLQNNQKNLITNDLLAIHKRCFTHVITQGLGIEQWFDQDSSAWLQTFLNYFSNIYF